MVKPMRGNMENTYKQLIVADQDQNRERATNLPILNEEAKLQIADACKYSSYFPNPITAPFMRKYILSKLEFPTKESELAQSITELNVRIDNLFQDAYTFTKTQLEVEEAQINVDEAEEKAALAQSDIEKRKAELASKKAQLELAHKEKSLKKIELTAMARYKEAMGWKQCVEDIMAEGGYKDLDEVPWDNVRMGEMQGKIKLWGELQSKNLLEMTPSKLQAILANTESFVEGVQQGQMQLEHAKQQMQLAHAGAPAEPQHAEVRPFKIKQD
jgi:hypothetical protein